jgi:hypothetical protein
MYSIVVAVECKFEVDRVEARTIYRVRNSRDMDIIVRETLEKDNKEGHIEFKSNLRIERSGSRVKLRRISREV